jgi:hypothetical protein
VITNISSYSSLHVYHRQVTHPIELSTQPILARYSTMPPKKSKFTNGFEPHPQSDFHSWPAKIQYSTANDNPDHAANTKNNGFGHLDVPWPPDDPIKPLDNPTLPTFEDGVEYLDLIEQKLSLARQFILTELENIPDFDDQDNAYQDLSKDAVARRLAAPPIVFSMDAQNLVRDLVFSVLRLKELEEQSKTGAEMMEAFNRIREQGREDAMARQRRENEEAVGLRREAEYKELGREFKGSWRNLRGILALMVPGKDGEVNREWATAMMERVFGTSLGEEDVEDAVETEVEDVVEMEIVDRMDET